MSWTNEDGLLVRFGTERGAVATDGATGAEEQVLIFEIADATALGDTDTAAEAGDRPYIPAGAIIRDALFVVDTAFTSGGSAVLDLGIKQADGTNVDDDGIDAAIAVASLTVRSGHESDGALIGTKMQYDSYPMATYDTAAFTAGAGRLIIKYTNG